MYTSALKRKSHDIGAEHKLETAQRERHIKYEYDEKMFETYNLKI
jgi:hypothetical protein